MARGQSSNEKKQNTIKALSDAEEYELFGYPHTEIQDCNFLEDVFTTYGHGIHDVLDIACGTGRHAIEMAKRGYSVTGIDISEDMLNLAVKKSYRTESTNKVLAKRYD